MDKGDAHSLLDIMDLFFPCWNERRNDQGVVYFVSDGEENFGFLGRIGFMANRILQEDD